MSPTEPYYQELVRHYECCLSQHGATHKGTDWPNAEDLATRFTVMLDLCKPLINQGLYTVLDLGCGYGAFLDYLKTYNFSTLINYKGIDLSFKMIEAAKERHDLSDFEVRDILRDKLLPASYDYIIMNGVFTEKRGLTQIEMESFFLDMIIASFDACRVGIAFNVMNFHVDWFRDELFYLPFDQMVSLLKQHTSRHITIRADYGLYEYTVYVYKQPNNSKYPS